MGDSSHNQGVQINEGIFAINLFCFHKVGGHEASLDNAKRWLIGWRMSEDQLKFHLQ